MACSSTGRLLGFSALVIQPSSVLPSNSSSQPSFFSWSVNSLSAARTEEVSKKPISSANAILMLAHHLFLLRVPQHRFLLPIRFDRQLDGHHGGGAQFGVAVER